MTKQEINEYFKYFTNSDPACDGLERFLSSNGAPEVFERLESHDNLKLNKVQFNQLLIISGLTSISFDFFKYYWLTLPDYGIYDYKKLELGYSDPDENGEERLVTTGGFEKDNIEKYFFESDGSKKEITEIQTIEHLRWGLLRLYSDALLLFGNITIGFNELNRMSEEELVAVVRSKRFNTEVIKERGHCIPFHEIEQNDRYLISEAVCKNLDADDATKTALSAKLIERYREAKSLGINNVKVGVLLNKDAQLSRYSDIPDLKAAKQKNEVAYTLEDDISTTEFIETIITSESDIDEIVTPLYGRFLKARKTALKNTKLYLSLVNDMDVYVATSMRTKDDFLAMAKNCYDIFHGSPPSVKELQLRYFDPTLSAAEGHDDKGLIECLMVQCAKVLIYSSGDKDSYGKDAEAAMALSSGKPVIFFCPHDIRYKVSKEIHPLTKLIDFKTGVANGAMIAKNIAEVRTLLRRLFHNDMQYMLTCEKIEMSDASTGSTVEKSYFKLKDTHTTSSVRVQTSDLFLAKSFWNYFSRHVKSE